jgi:hypothetical protein
MKNLFTIVSFIFLFLRVGMESFGQVTYTSNGTCNPNQANYFGTVTCWTKTGTCNVSTTPPTSGTADCPVIIEINHEINIVNFDLGANVTLQVNEEGKLNISGNLTQPWEITSNIIVDGGEINLIGSLAPVSGRNNQPETILNISLLNNGFFNIGFIDIDNRTVINIDGDQTSNVITNDIDLGNVATINVLAGGGLIVNNDTKYSGNSSKINIWGVFETNNLTISGGGQTELNVYGNAQVTIKENVLITGDSKMFFGGDSNVLVEGEVEVRGTNSGLTLGDNNTTKIIGDINLVGGGTMVVEDSAQLDVEGNLEVDGNSQFRATDTAEVYICGTRPGGNVVDSNGKVKAQITLYCNDAETGEPCAVYGGCRILPVEFTYHNAHHNTKTRTSVISWATGKEWESSHFEIERTLNSVEFEKIGEVMAMGFKDSITEYEFMDEDLPLSGGNVLYRLKQVDMNGNYAYSPVMSVRTSGIEFTSGIWRAYPNPTNGNQLRISLLDRAQYEEEKITFRLVHPSAQSQVMAVASEEEMNAALAQMVGRIPKGVFVVEIQWGQKVEHIKVLKQ